MVMCERCYLYDGANVPLVQSSEVREEVLAEVWPVQVVSWRLVRQQFGE